MKRILFACLLGLATLLPTNKIAAEKNFFHRIIDIYIEGIVLIANSDESSGKLVSISIYNSSNQVVLSQYCGDYSCGITLSSLRHGNYRAHVVAANDTYDEYFTY